MLKKNQYQRKTFIVCFTGFIKFWCLFFSINRINKHEKSQKDWMVIIIMINNDNNNSVDTQFLLFYVICIFVFWTNKNQLLYYHINNDVSCCSSHLCSVCICSRVSHVLYSSCADWAVSCSCLQTTMDVMDYFDTKVGYWGGCGTFSLDGHHR